MENDKNTTVTEVYALRDYVDKNGKPAKYSCLEGSVLPYNLNNFIQESIEKGIEPEQILDTLIANAGEPCYISSRGKVSCNGEYGAYPLTPEQINKIKSVNAPATAGGRISKRNTLPDVGQGESLTAYKIRCMQLGTLRDDIAEFWNLVTEARKLGEKI